MSLGLTLQQRFQESHLKPKKSFGQNFLQDEASLVYIAQLAERERLALPEACTLVELGAGFGALTAQLLTFTQLDTLQALEYDRDLLTFLQQNLGEQKKLQLQQADISKLDYRLYAHPETQNLLVVGNLPYNLAGRILVTLSNVHNCTIQRAILLIQYEVAERLVAPPGSKTYGLLSVLVQKTFRAELVRIVPRTAFYPPPKVTSAVVLLSYNPQVPRQDAQILDLTAKAAFSQRRKTLRNALSSFFNYDKLTTQDRLLPLLETIAIASTRRAETLSVQEFYRLALALKQADLLPG